MKPWIRCFFRGHVWDYTKPGWERRCTRCGRIEDACLVDVGMNKLWFKRRE